MRELYAQTVKDTAGEQPAKKRKKRLDIFESHSWKESSVTWRFF